MKATNTQAPDAAGARPVGTAKVMTNATGSASAPRRIQVRRVPEAASARSLRSPIHGSTTTSHTFAAVTTSPATRAVTPRVSVR